MPLKLNLNIPNKAVHAFIGLIVLAVIASGAYAYVVLPGSTPNPGHALSTIQGFFQGDASLLDSLSKLQQRPVAGMSCPADQSIRTIDVEGNVTCEVDDAGGGISCVTRTSGYAVGPVSVACAGGETITGGGCQPALGVAWVQRAYFSGNSYVCSALAAGGPNVTVRAYARCCS